MLRDIYKNWQIQWKFPGHIQSRTVIWCILFLHLNSEACDCAYKEKDVTYGLASVVALLVSDV